MSGLPQRLNRRNARITPEHATVSTVEPDALASDDFTATSEHCPAVNLPEYRSAQVGSFKFEYLDHTADVQLHSWGATLQEAFEQCGQALFNYMVPLKGVKIDDALTREFVCGGHDLQSLLFNFLDELLFTFSTEYFVCKEVVITSFDTDAFKIIALGHGEIFNRQLHEHGTEIKAITYSNMQIWQGDGEAEVFVIVDICAAVLQLLRVSQLYYFA